LSDSARRRVTTEDVELAGVVLEIDEAPKAVTRRFANPRRTGPAPWKPLVTLSGPTTLPIAFDA